MFLATPAPGQTELASARPRITDTDVRLAIARGRASLPSTPTGNADLPAGSVAERAVRVLLAPTLEAAPSPVDVDWLIDQQLDSGGWGFGRAHPNTEQVPSWTDITNTQLAIAALRESDHAGQDIPAEVFERARRYVLSAQNPDGGWGYTPPAAAPLRVRGASHGSATAAALALLADAPPADDADDREAWQEALETGLAWLTERFTLASVPGWVWGADRDGLHYPYAVQRFANARGLRRLNGDSLRNAIARRLLETQQAGGNWSVGNDGCFDTCMAMLALAEVRRPVLVTYLPLAARDDADVAGWVERCRSAFAQPYGWQPMDPAGPAAAPSEGATLFIGIESDLALPGPWPGAIRSFVESGGAVVIATQTDDAATLADMAARLANVLGDAWSVLTDPSGHVTLTAKHTLTVDGLKGTLLVGNRMRPVAAVLPKSVGDALTIGPNETTEGIFQVMDNLAVAMTGTDPPRARSPLADVGAGVYTTLQQIPVARVKHEGNWRLAPNAIGRLDRTLASTVSIGVAETDPVDLKTPPVKRTVLWLTAAGKPAFNAFERKVLLSWLVDGGTVFIDTALGDAETFDALKETVTKMSDGAPPTPIPIDHPLVTGAFAGGIGNDLRGVSYSPAVTDAPVGPSLYGMDVEGRLAVIISRYGVTPAVADAPAFGAKTLSTADAHRLAANVLLWAVHEGR